MRDGGGLPKGRDGGRRGMDLLNVTSGCTSRHRKIYFVALRKIRGALFVLCLLPLDVAKSHTLELRYLRMPELIIIYRLMNVYGKLRLLSPPIGENSGRPADGPAESYLLFMRTSYDGAVH